MKQVQLSVSNVAADGMAPLADKASASIAITKSKRHVWPYYKRRSVIEVTDLRVVRNVTHLPLDKMAAISADDIFRCIFVNEKFCILIKISLKIVPKGLIDNNAALVQVMAWRRTGDKPLSEPMYMS